MISKLLSFQVFRTVITSAAVVLLVILSVGRGDSISPLRLVAGEHEQDLVRWELTHFMDKWFARVIDLTLRSSPNDGERLAAVHEFFRLRDDIAALNTSPQSPLDVQAAVDALKQRRF